MAQLSTASTNSEAGAGLCTWNPGEVIANRYEIIKLLGDGTFGRVLEVQDLEEGVRKAVKVVMPVGNNIEEAKLEAQIIRKLNNADTDDTKHIIRLYTTFDWEENYYMIFEKLGDSLRDVLEKNNYTPFELGAVKSFARQIFESLEFLKQIGVTHADLKPENILLVNNGCVEGPDGTLVPADSRIKLIDFGTATYDTANHARIVCTQYYRPPEVIMGVGWDNSCDLWSIGCILAELCSACQVFRVDEDYEHLAMIEKVIGRIPLWMINYAEPGIKHYFDRKTNRLNWPKHITDM